ncbi:MAG: hypothetical protein BWY42_01814 [Candidatus Omnitrophica bacterium ADurb.Bin277]|nr:MAG: hypothetical protein BWY42_01814 [Candidatus Omnitrophica bacterium ADurb.Bin277]
MVPASREKVFRASVVPFPFDPGFFLLLIRDFERKCQEIIPAKLLFKITHGFKGCFLRQRAEVDPLMEISVQIEIPVIGDRKI